ncbi:MAG TPA: hypothetical protein ENK18_16135 [Deltaproteobacteria bacterium]|nr:hypothetical protein [Deltaproteobacteria bacterium]
MTAKDGPTTRDALLLAQIGSEEDPPMPELDTRWESLAAGTLTSEEQRALSLEAEGDPLAEAALVAFSPLDASFHRRVATFAPSHYHRRPPEEPGPQPWGWLRWAVPLLAGAALVVAVLRSSGGDPQPLPPYRATWSSGEQVVRGEGDPQSIPGFVAGSTLELILSPSTRIEVDPVVLVYLDRWGPRHALELAPELAATGAVRLRGVIGTPPLELQVGPHRLLIAVGPAGAEPPAGPPGAPWQQLQAPFEIQ